VSYRETLTSSALIASPTAGNVVRTVFNDMNDKGKSVSLIKPIVSDSTPLGPAKPLTKRKIGLFL